MDVASRLGGEEGDSGPGGGPGGVEIVWDAVLSHKTAGDDVEETWAVEVDPDGEFSFQFLFVLDAALSHFQYMNPSWPCRESREWQAPCQFRSLVLRC
jgi:hypothetical protein